MGEYPWARGVHYTPPPIPVGFQLFQQELVESPDSDDIFLICSLLYLD